MQFKYKHAPIDKRTYAKQTLYYDTMRISTGQKYQSDTEKSI